MYWFEPRLPAWQEGDNARMCLRIGWVLVVIILAGCKPGIWNDPYPQADIGKNILYSSFSERPKHLDPARSYASNEVVFTGQIYEPPLQYAYLARPYRLEALTATTVPKPYYLDADHRRLVVPVATDKIAYSVYEIHIRPGIRYQPHPAFAKDAQGRARYLSLTADQLSGLHSIGDFAHTGTRELVAADYVYEIKRLADPRVQSPIFGIMSEYIVGLHQYAATLRKARLALQAQGHAGAWLDLRRFPLTGAQVVNRYTYRITLKGRYPQFKYWLAMPFFAPVAPEVDRFYAQPGMRERNLTLDWWPVGTGPYMLTVNNPNRKMVLTRNPNYRHDDDYPRKASAEDVAHGLLADAGKPMPFIDEAIYSLEKESIPRWTKFLQGYYDVSGITSDSFDQAIQFNGQNALQLTETMRAKGIRLSTTVLTSNFYLGFNMLNPVVGGYTEQARALRQAISIAINYEEYISIFLNGRGIPAQGPLPPGIFGYETGREGIDPYVYTWRDGHAQRRSISDARHLLAEAGYPNGRSAKTGRPLLIHLDIAAGGPEDKAMLDWYRKQFHKLNVELIIRNTDYNRFQDKMRKGKAQLFLWGWNADYPDPENFLFLLYGPNGKMRYGGENAANYNNPQFNRLFTRMKDMDNGPARYAVIRKMLAIVRRDAPWAWGFNPKQFVLYHDWYKNADVNLMANNTLKYKRIVPAQRVAYVATWNRPVLWPVWFLLLAMAFVLWPALAAYRRKQRRSALSGTESTPK